MLLKDVPGHENLKNHLALSAKQGRIPHAQLFVGEEGSGTLQLALAYASQVLSLPYEEGSEAHRACLQKCENLVHPDLHFVFPTATNQDIKTNAVSDAFLPQWRQFIKTQPFGSLYDWYQHLGIEKKQGFIRVEDSHDVIRKLSLKSYEGGYKIMLIWMAEKMNTEASNKLLKLIEEPPQQTLLILISADENQLLQTIQSRCQIIRIPKFSEPVIEKYLTEKFQLSSFDARQTAVQADGNMNKATKLLNPDAEDDGFEDRFVRWVRLAFGAKGNKASVLGLIEWAEELAATGRETQKKFLGFCTEMFRQAILINKDCKELVFYQSKNGKFDLNKFAPFVHPGNIFDIYEALQTAGLHIERNGNAKIVLTDLSLKLTRLLHQKPNELL